MRWKVDLRHLLGIMTDAQWQHHCVEVHSKGRDLRGRSLNDTRELGGYQIAGGPLEFGSRSAYRKSLSTRFERCGEGRASIERHSFTFEQRSDRPRQEGQW